MLYVAPKDIRRRSNWSGMWNTLQGHCHGDFAAFESELPTSPIFQVAVHFHRSIFCQPRTKTNHAYSINRNVVFWLPQRSRALELIFIGSFAFGTRTDFYWLVTCLSIPVDNERPIWRKYDSEVLIKSDHRRSTSW